MANDKNNVSAGKPKVGGAIYYAPEGTVLPEDAVSDLSEEFVNLGYCSDDGLKNSSDISTQEIKAWGGDTVMNPQTDFSDSFSFTLLEVLNVDVLKAVYGADNVSGDLETGISVAVSSEEHGEFVWVFDMIMRGGALKRIVIPSASITSLSEITYSDSSAVGYGVKLGATADSGGNTHYEYLYKASAGGAAEEDDE